MKDGDKFLLQLEITRLLEQAKRQALIFEVVNAVDELILSDQQRKCIAECKN